MPIHFMIRRTGEKARGAATPPQTVPRRGEENG